VDEFSSMRRDPCAAVYLPRVLELRPYLLAAAGVLDYI
jgi:hypothetical protein